MFWTETELYRWTTAIDTVAEDSETVEESEFYNLWVDDLFNSPPANDES